jgi:thymidylate kinase
MKIDSGQHMRIVSFSGIDGAGKTTQIEALMRWLQAAGLRVELLRFWDNIVVGSRFREGMSHKVFKGDEGIGSPDKPLNRRDKNVTSLPVTTARFFLYLLDALNVGRKIRQQRKAGTEVLIFDRYIYDELANLPLYRWITRAFISGLLHLVPAPDIAYVVDADPIAARSRKPEYPLEFIHKNRQAYLTLASLEKRMTVIEPLPIHEAELKIRQAFLRGISSPSQTLAALAKPENRTDVPAL